MKSIYIKRVFRVLVVVALVSTFVSCTHSAIDQPEEQEQALLLSAMQVNFVDDSVATRATDAAFQGGDVMGVYLHSSTVVAPTGNHSSNMRYSYSLSDKGATWRAGNALGDKLVVGTSYYATAYYPHIPTIANTTAVAHSVATDQSAAVGTAAGALEKSDFMVSAVAPLLNASSPTPSVNFVFSHVMTKMVVSISVPAVIDGAVIERIKSVSIDGTKLGATVNLATKAVTATGGSAPITPRMITGDGTAGKVSSFEAIVVPQTIAGGVQLVTIVCSSNSGDKTLSYSVPNASPLVLQSGKKVSLTLSSSADVAFTRELDLLDGQAKTNLEFGVKVITGGAWTLTAPAGGWLKLAGKTTDTPSYSISGVGTGAEQMVYVTVGANTVAGSVVREAQLTLSCGSGSSAVTVSYTATQNYYKFGPQSKTLAPLGGQSVMTVDAFDANQVWSATSDQSWLKMSDKATYGDGDPKVSFGPYVGSLADGKMFYHCDANNTAAERTAIVSFKSTTVADAAGVNQTIKQKAPEISVSKDDIKITKDTAELAVELFTVTVPLGVKWKVLSVTAEGSGTKDMGLDITSHVVGTEQTGDGTEVPIEGTYEGNTESSSRFTKVVISYATHVVAQQKTIKITQEAAGPPVNPPKETDYVTIGSLKWTKGNLVAVSGKTDECKVGAPTDHGLYFQFGSLLGWKGGATGDGTGICTKANGTFFNGSFNAAKEIHVKPALFTTIDNISTTWPNQTKNLYYFGDNSYATAYAKLRDFAGFSAGTLAASGVGDPCTYYLGGTWRMPTAEEWKALCNNAGNGSAWSSCGASWTGNGGNFSGGKLFFPASGYRKDSDGAIYSVGTHGNYWSESVSSAAHGYNLGFGSGGVNPQNGGYRRNGFPVRCVQ